MTVETPEAVAEVQEVKDTSTTKSQTIPATDSTNYDIEVENLSLSEAIVAIGNDALANGSSTTTASTSPSTPSGTVTPSSASVTTLDDDNDIENNDDDSSDVFQDAVDELPATRKLHQRLSQYLPQSRQVEEWEQIMQDWERVMAEKRIQDAKLNLVEQENKRMRAQVQDLEASKAELEKEYSEKLNKLEVANKELVNKTKDPAKETVALKSQLEEADAEKELFKLMLEETEGEKKRIELRAVQLEKEKDQWGTKAQKINALKNRLRLRSAQFQLLSTSTSALLAQIDGTKPDKERKRLMDQVITLESDRSRLAAMVKDTINSTTEMTPSGSTAVDVSTLSNEELVNENMKLSNELQMAKVECSLLQRRIEAFEVTLHDVRVALANSEAHAENLEMKKYDLQDKLAAAEGNLDRARIESTKYQALHKEMLEKNDKLDREMQVVKARFEAKDRVLVTTQKQLAAAKADGGLLKTIRRELESVLFDYNTVVQHFMDIQVQAIAAKSLANNLKRKNNELQAQLTHYRSMLLGIKSFNNNDPIKSPTVTTLRSEFRVLLEKIQEEHNAQVDKERADRSKAQDWNRKLRMEKDFMKLELQNQIEKWRRVSIYWEDKWRKTANDLHEAVTSGTTSDVLFEIASAHPNLQQTGATPPSVLSSPRPSQSLTNSAAAAKRRSLAILTSIGGGSSSTNSVGPNDAPMTPSAMKQQIMESKLRSAGSSNSGGSGLHSRQNSSSLFQASPSFASLINANPPVTAISSPPLPANTSPSTATLTVGAITESITDLVSSVKPFLSRSISQTSSNSSTSPTGAPSSLIGSVGTGRGRSNSVTFNPLSHNPGPLSPSSRLAAASTLRTPIAAGLPANVTGVGAKGNTSVSKTSLRSRSMATSAIGTARSQALQANISSSSTVTLASRDAQTRASASISSMGRSVDQALSESEQLKADVRRMLNR
ncbi:hypothetical protein BX616_007201 [Lobosporangium transversale]|uniref:Uncharacterized protein n=1 Tax=Lobosporangium transversale TaxID=64571 RepID=A0A1Y2GIT2_9FUNG|nr:hypothetical protein BCR41DRAFT_423284 [Lobosporangium transversale]KAF9914961.1 hypothetical protein BX616_007201 [Lobosporangium transversale]ORZ12092.1 hypothetical protein BCR41DRAFT_423284 [Lobosporangium transversale]|eukprot:XP_021879957.1 hypothetical protein BCR41DRAFT_423284 [Lobosporangium transversale]